MSGKALSLPPSFVRTPSRGCAGPDWAALKRVLWRYPTAWLDRASPKACSITETEQIWRPGQAVMQKSRLGGWPSCNDAWLDIKTLEVLLELTY